MSSNSLIFSPDFTPGYEPAVEAQLAASVPGMAHFAGTGPAGATCHLCQHWGSYHRFARNAGRLLPRQCQKFKRLMQGLAGAGIPAETPACKYLEPRPKPPKLYSTRAKRGEA